MCCTGSWAWGACRICCVQCCRLLSGSCYCLRLTCNGDLHNTCLCDIFYNSSFWFAKMCVCICVHYFSNLRRESTTSCFLLRSRPSKHQVVAGVGCRPAVFPVTKLLMKSRVPFFRLPRRRRGLLGAAKYTKTKNETKTKINTNAKVPKDLPSHFPVITLVIERARVRVCCKMRNDPNWIR